MPADKIFVLLLVLAVVLVAVAIQRARRRVPVREHPKSSTDTAPLSNDRAVANRSSEDHATSSGNHKKRNKESDLQRKAKLEREFMGPIREKQERLERHKIEAADATAKTAKPAADFVARHKLADLPVVRNNFLFGNWSNIDSQWDGHSVTPLTAMGPMELYEAIRKCVSWYKEERDFFDLKMSSNLNSFCPDAPPKPWYAGFELSYPIHPHKHSWIAVFIYRVGTDQYVALMHKQYSDYWGVEDLG